MQCGKLPILRGVLLLLVIAALPGLALADADYGDAPSAYPDAWHDDGSFEWLGAAWDAEPGSINSPDAQGDDTTGVDDEDGVNFVYDQATKTLNIYATMSVFDRFYRDPLNSYRFRYSTGPGGLGQALYLRGWWDSNHDGAFDYIAENVIYANYNPRTDWTSNTYTAHFQVPNFTPRKEGDVFRFRFAYGGPAARNIQPSGGTEYGEVGDYFITPEPASLALLGAGVAFLIRRRRRRK